MNISGIRQRLHVVLCLESESHNTHELFESYPSLYKCTEIIWIASTAIASPEFVAEELIGKLYGEFVPSPMKYLNIVGTCDNEWRHSAYRFKNLIFAYGTFYKDMMSNIQKQQNILQVNIVCTFFNRIHEIFSTILMILLVHLDVNRLVLINYRQPMR